MPIDPTKALGAEIQSGKASWTRDDVILYHLAVGAGVPPTAPGELEYAYERNLKVLPSYGVIPSFRSLGGLASVPGLSFNPALLLHGEQDLEIHRPIPVEATVTTSGKIAAIYDKGKAAVIVLETVSRLDSGDPLFTNRFSIFLRGEGGFGGDPGPKAGNQPPARDPDQIVESPTLPQQALLYRLCGDKNPLHADPDFAKLGGFDRPILHGLCSFGIVCKAVVDHALKGDVGKVARYQVRFAGVVFPGETIVTSLWREGSSILVSAQTRERSSPVLSNASLAVRA